MGSHCEAQFENATKTVISGDYQEQNLEGLEEATIFSVSPGKTFNIDIEFNNFNYFRFSINTKDGDKANYFEVRSVSDFLMLQQVLINDYKLKLISARPDYKKFWSK